MVIESETWIPPFSDLPKKKEKRGKAKREEKDRILTLEKNLSFFYLSYIRESFIGLSEVSHSGKLYLGQEVVSEAKKGPGGDQRVSQRKRVAEINSRYILIFILNRMSS